MKYICELCGHIYDEALGDPGSGIPAGTPFANIPRHWSCPSCGCEKEAFCRAEKAERAAATGARNDTFWQETKYPDAKHESER